MNGRRHILLWIGTLVGVAATVAGFVTRTSLAATFGVALLVSCAVALWLHANELRHERKPAERDSGTDRVRGDTSAAPVPALAAPAQVCGHVIDSVRAVGDPVAAYLWLQDGPQGVLRLVASSTPAGTSGQRLDPADPALGDTLEHSRAVLTDLSSVRTEDGTSVLWRYAAPVAAGDHSGIVAVDVLCESQPDVRLLEEAVGSLAGELAGTLALDAARVQTEAAATLLETARELSSIVSVEDVLEACLTKAIELTEAATGSIMLMDDETGSMRIAAARGLPEDVTTSTAVSSGEGISGWVLMSGRPALVQDLPSRPGPGRHGVRSALSVPIADDSGTLGVLNVGSRAYPARFTAAHMSAVETIGRQTAVALRNARAIATARELHFSTLRALALALETKDPYSSGATDRVVGYTTAIVEAMSIPETQAEAVRLAAILHDICMDTTSDVSSRKRQLSTVERGMLSMHPVLAAEILAQAPSLEAVAPIVYHHHEWFNGGGYVGGLSGDEIPLGARILAVADAYTAMTSDRPYRAALSQREALAELEAKAGTQFDPLVVATLVGLVREGREGVSRQEGR